MQKKITKFLMSDQKYVKSICNTLVTKRYRCQLTNIHEPNEGEIVKIPTPSRDNLVIFIRKAEKPLSENPILLYAHGDGCNIEGCDYSEYFCPYGVSFCVFDYRGNGFSDGDLNTAAINETEDCITVVNYLISQGNVLLVAST